MKHLNTILISLLALCYTTANAQILKPEQLHIPGHYEYVHAWDYPAPDGNGTIHCDETGTLDFYTDGTFADTAIQHHQYYPATSVKVVQSDRSPDTMELTHYEFKYNYYCQGLWRVEKGKFLFSEHAEGFHMDFLNKPASHWARYYADIIENKTRPNSSRWFTFDIKRLDEEWFIWTYTYPNGRIDSWEMKRTRQ